MKLFTCMAHASPDKLHFLVRVLAAQAQLPGEVHVCVITHTQDARAIAAILACAPPQTDRFKVEVFNEGCDQLPSPWLLTWVHKKLLLQKFADPSYTHFMCIEDDMEITADNITYWLRDREKLKPFNLYPSFLRVEWNRESAQWAMPDFHRGDRFRIGDLPRLTLTSGYGYINLPRTYQGMFLYDRELMREHIDSVSFDLFRFVPDWQSKIRNTAWPLGLTEAAVLGLTHINVPPGCLSRNFVPYHIKYGVIDPTCFVHHLPDKYTNTPGSEHGKVMVSELLHH